MGTDIHFVVEYAIDDYKWIGLYSTDYNRTIAAKKRNYYFFDLLFGCKNNNIDEDISDASDLSKYCLECDSGDAHSVGVLSLETFVGIYLQSLKNAIDHSINHYNKEFIKRIDKNFVNVSSFYLENIRKQETEYNEIKKYPYVCSMGLNLYEDEVEDFVEEIGKYRVVYWFDN